MSGRNHKDFRRQANKVAERTLEKLAEPLVKHGAITDKHESRLNEHQTALEQHEADLAALLGLASRGFFGRMHWLLRGR